MKIPKIPDKLQNIHYGNRLRPVRDWLILVSVATVVLVVGAVWNIVEFKNSVSEQGSGINTNMRSVVNMATIEKVQKTFVNRDKMRARYEKGFYYFEDPSL